MTELEIHRPTNSMTETMDYARAVSSASMLPETYRGKPADIMLAVGLGQSMGLSPAESLYRIAVIKGKPTASAELVAANVRKAGHRLRVTTDEKAMSATATIVRADDPDFEFTVERGMDWAKSMGLSSNDNYRKQPLTMLANRAITACARLACPEALYGVAYTADEMWDSDERPTRTGLASALADPVPTVTPVESEPIDVSEAEVVEDEPKPMTARSRGQMFALFGQKGVPEDQQLPGINHITGSGYTSRADITEADAKAVIAVLKTRPDAEPAEGDQ